MKITMVTNNKGKWKIVKDIFKDFDIELDWAQMDTPEIQSENVEDVATYSAEYASNKLNTLVMKSDVGYYIDALNGFPGPFLKYINNMLDSEDILTMMNGKKDRTIIMRECITIAGPNFDTKKFVNEEKATLAKIPEGEGTSFDKILIFEGQQKPKSLNTEEENIKHFEESLKIYYDIANYLTNNK